MEVELVCFEKKKELEKSERGEKRASVWMKTRPKKSRAASRFLTRMTRRMSGMRFEFDNDNSSKVTVPREPVS